MNNTPLETILIDALNRQKDSAIGADFLKDKNREGKDDIVEQYFSFSIGTDNFIVHAGSFCEVFSEIFIAPVPNASVLFAGLCNIRSSLVPVYQLYAVLGHNLPRKRCVLTIGKGDRTVGLLINELPVSLSLNPVSFITELDSSAAQREETSPAREHVMKTLAKGKLTSHQLLRHLLDGDGLAEQLLSLAANSTLNINELTSNGTQKEQTL